LKTAACGPVDTQTFSVALLLRGRCASQSRFISDLLRQLQSDMRLTTGVPPGGTSVSLVMQKDDTTGAEVRGCSQLPHLCRQVAAGGAGGNMQGRCQQLVYGVQAACNG
jgi:hypothetical protein